jgi:fructose/tagatose bisphosphate aldolase
MPAKFSQQQLDAAALDLALSTQPERDAKAADIRRLATREGVYPASIGPVYRGLARGRIAPLTVPAMNLRGLTYGLARAVFRSAKRLEAGPVMFELAPSESVVTGQSFAEYCAQVLAAAVREGYRGAVYLQGDHFEVESDAQGDLPCLEERSRAAIAGGMRQIDLDAAGLAGTSPVAPGVEALDEAAAAEDRQRPNALATAHMLTVLRRLAGESAGGEAAELVIGGEVGEIGGANTTPDELRAFLRLVAEALPAGVRGLDKVSVQTGTRHGGVVERDGSVGRMPIDLDLASTLSQVARSEFGLPGVVQHGASTLSMDQLGRLPDAGVMEVHLATGIQNLVFDHTALPAALTERMARELNEESLSHAESGKYETPADLSERQRFVMSRWKAWGRYKRELWMLEPRAQAAIFEAMEAWATELLTVLRLAGKRTAVNALLAREEP